MKPFTLLRDNVIPVLEERRADLDAMYSRVMGRPEVDPVLLIGVTILQMMEKFLRAGLHPRARCKILNQRSRNQTEPL